MIVLVTGGHGFLGSHVVDALLARGDRVRCLVRGDRVPAALAGKDVEIVRGDVRDERAVRAAVEGVEEVHHLAALTRSLTRREMMGVNAGGTAVVVAAAADARLPGRFLLCSTEAVVGPTTTPDVLDESAPMRPVTWYGESKVEAERIALAASDRVAVTIARPCAVYGPRDKDFLALFRAAAHGLRPVLQLSPRALSMVYAPEAGEALVLLARSPATVGKVYFVAHPEALTAEVLAERAARAVGRAARRLTVPAGATRLVASISHLAAQVTGKAPLLNRERLKEMAGPYWLCSPEAARRDAGWSAEVGTEEGFRRTAAWYREQGLLR